MVIWGFIGFLMFAVFALLWMHWQGKKESIQDNSVNLRLEEKVIHLEENLKKTLEIMQDVVKKMHIQQEVLDQSVEKQKLLELQNSELVSLLAQTIKVDK